MSGFNWLIFCTDLHFVHSGLADPVYFSWGKNQGLTEDTLLALYEEGIMSEDNLRNWLAPTGPSDTLQRALKRDQLNLLNNVCKKLTTAPGLNHFCQPGKVL
jgi:hypothetical protein